MDIGHGLTFCLLTFHVFIFQQQQEQQEKNGSGLHVEQKQSNRNLLADGKAIYRWGS